MNKVVNTKQISWLSLLFWGLLITLNMLFLVYWIGLSMNYCLHYDDVHFMWKLREYSIFEYVREMYMSRGGNFVGYGINGIVFSLSNRIGDYHWWSMLFYTLGVAMTYFSIKDCFHNIAHWKVFIGVLAIYNVYVLTVPDYAVFTWLCAMSYFLYGPAICLLLRLLNKPVIHIGGWIILCLLALFLSGTNVPLTPMVWVLMLANGIWQLRQAQWNVRRAWTNYAIRRIVFVALGMFVIYAIMFVAPGNFARLSAGDDMEHPANISQFAMAWTKCIVMFLYMMLFYFPYHLLAILLGYLAGTQAKTVIQQRWQCVIWIMIAFAVYICIAVIPLAYLSNGFGIQRNYTQIAFFYILMWFAIGYVWGNQRKTYTIWVQRSTSVVTLFLIAVMCVNIHTDFPIARKYNRAHIERIDYLNTLQQEGHTKEVAVTPYPSTATIDAKYIVLKALGKKTSQQHIYYESDTNTTSNEYASHLRKLYGWDFDIVLQH